MHEKRMLIAPAQLINKINENRGDMSQSDFIDFLIESYLEQDSKEQSYVTKEELQGFEQVIKGLCVKKDELQGFEQGIKGLLRSFLEFFISYGLELGKEPGSDKFEELDHKLQGLGVTSSARGKGEGAEM
jgi:hypothetical protein